MLNILTLYRFNTPFLNIESEKTHLLSIKDKLKVFLSSQWLDIIESRELRWEYQNIFFECTALKLRFQYIKEFKNSYYMPIFKMDLYLDESFIWDASLKKTTLFLTSFLENFDGLNEKEYLLDLSDAIYYKSGIFWTKIYPQHDFQQIEVVKKNFESNNGTKQLESFLYEYKNKNFVLSTANSDEFHKIHAIILYYIYLVYIMYKTIQDSEKTLCTLSDLWECESKEHIELMRERLHFVNDMSVKNFNVYYARLQTFFSLFQ